MLVTVVVSELTKDEKIQDNQVKDLLNLFTNSLFNFR